MTISGEDKKAIRHYIMGGVSSQEEREIDRRMKKLGLLEDIESLYVQVSCLVSNTIAEWEKRS